MGSCCTKPALPDVDITTEVAGNNCCDGITSECCEDIDCCIIKIYSRTPSNKRSQSTTYERTLSTATQTAPIEPQ